MSSLPYPPRTRQEHWSNTCMNCGRPIHDDGSVPVSPIRHWVHDDSLLAGCDAFDADQWWGDDRRYP